MLDVFVGKIGTDIYIQVVVKLLFKKILVVLYLNQKIFANLHYDVLDLNILLINLYSNTKPIFKEVNLDDNNEIIFLSNYSEIVAENRFKDLDLLDRLVHDFFEV